MAFIIVDGIDGSGKGFIVDELKRHYLKSGLKVFDLRNFTKIKQCFPSDLQLQDYDVIISTEPSYCNTGKILRESLLKDPESDPMQIAKMFAEDRKEIYERIIIPWKKTKIIVQERGIISSLVYQPLTSEEITVETIKGLEGNKIALKNAPDYLLIPKISAELASERLNSRKKQDDAFYEKLDFQKKLEKEYESDWLKQLFNELGTKVIYINTNKTLDDTKSQVNDFLSTL